MGLRLLSVSHFQSEIVVASLLDWGESAREYADSNAHRGERGLARSRAAASGVPGMGGIWLAFGVINTLCLPGTAPITLIERCERELSSGVSDARRRATIFRSERYTRVGDRRAVDVTVPVTIGYPLSLPNHNR